MKFATFFGGAALLALLTLTLSNHNAVGQTLLSNPGGDTNPPVDPGDPYDGVAPSPQAYQIPTPNMYVAAGSDSAYAGINGALNWCIVGGSNPYVSIPIGREKMPVWQPPNGGVVAYPGNPELVTAQLDVMFYALGVGQELAIRINSNEVFELTSTQNESWGQLTTQIPASILHWAQNFGGTLTPGYNSVEIVNYTEGACTSIAYASIRVGSPQPVFAIHGLGGSPASFTGLASSFIPYGNPVYLLNLQDQTISARGADMRQQLANFWPKPEFGTRISFVTPPAA